MNPRTAASRALPCILIVAAGAAVAATAAAPGAAGRWDGIVIEQSGRAELDLTLEIVSESQRWAGYLSVPTQAIDRRRLDALEVEDQKVSFVYKDASGESRFVGYLGGNDSLSGDFSEGGRTLLCRFWRAPQGPRSALKLSSLDANGAELRQVFNDEQSHPRLLVVLSPTCHDCKASALMVQRYLLAPGRFPDLRVFVVWEPAQGRDHDTGAGAASQLLRDDPRASQFWSESRYAGTAFRRQLGFTASPAWDVFLLFAPGVRWTAEAPAATMMMNNRSPDQEVHFDAERLAAKITELGTRAR
jgi:hypothetical protein